VIQRHPESTERFLLLSRGGANLPALKGSALRMVDRAHWGVPRHWLETILCSANGGAPDQFFGSVTDCLLTQEAVLPTFFASAGACLVPEKDFQLLAELNPQLAQGLTVVATSPPLVPLLMVRHRDYQSPMLALLIERAVRLHETPHGQQILTLLKHCRFGRFREEDFTDTRHLAASTQKTAQPHS